MLALAIGIGANTGVFSVVNALILRSLPFHDPGRLAYLRWFFEPHDSAKQFHDWRRQSAYLADAAVFEQLDANLGGAGAWQRAHVVQASSNFFQVLGTQPVMGRGFAAGDDVDANGWGLPGRNAIAVIGYGLWQQLFGGNPKALGSTIRLDGNPLTIVGVAPPGFDYPGNAVLWKPAAFSNGNNGWETVARLKPGIAWPRARQAFSAEAERLWPNRTHEQRIQFPSTMTELRDELAGPARKGSLVLMGCVLLILVIACTNVANLLMARTADRSPELSIRSAMGASRARLSRQLLTECLLLSLAASVAAICLAFWTTSIGAKFQPAALASQAYSILDGRVLVFAVAVAAASAVMFGLLPSVYATRIRSPRTHGLTDSRGARLIRESLVAFQVMLTIILLAGSISVGRAFLKLMSVDRGFTTSGLVTANVSLEGTVYQTEARRLGYFQEALERIRRLPGVRSASSTEFLPLYATAFIGGPFRLGGRQASQSSMVVPVFTAYFRTMGGRLLAGREFAEAELRGNARVAVVNDLFASEFGPPDTAVGRTISMGGDSWRVVGVVKRMDYMAEGANSSQVFVPSHSPGSFFSTFVVRVDGPAQDHIPMVRGAVQSVDPEVPVFGVMTMEQRLDAALARPHFYRTAVLCFAAFALLLAVVGIYGIVSYTVARRSREMGIRLALGTTPGRLRTRLTRQGLTPIAAGAIPGLGGALVSGRVLEDLVTGAQSPSAGAYAATVFFICLVATGGIWIATRPIARMDIGEILRTE
jgi:predicted permease